MKIHSFVFPAMSVATIIFSQSALGDDFTMTGDLCWVGNADTIAAEGGNYGGTFELEGSWVDRADEAGNAFYRCVGFYAGAGGKAENTPWVCNFTFADESTLFLRADTLPDGSAKGSVLAGTGRFEGATGTMERGVEKAVGKPPAGKFAHCTDGTIKVSIKKSG